VIIVCCGQYERSRGGRWRQRSQYRVLARERLLERCRFWPVHCRPGDRTVLFSFLQRRRLTRSIKRGEQTSSVRSRFVDHRVAASVIVVYDELPVPRRRPSPHRSTAAVDGSSGGSAAAARLPLQGNAFRSAWPTPAGRLPWNPSTLPGASATATSSSPKSHAQQPSRSPGSRSANPNRPEGLVQPLARKHDRPPGRDVSCPSARPDPECTQGTRAIVRGFFDAVVQSDRSCVGH
jgi:hypothetical protein